MKQHLIDKNSDTLLIFFTGWGCDEYEFEHLEASSDVLILYDYSGLNLEFDFSKYKEFNLLAFSAGVFIGSIFDFDFKINKKVAVSGNPYLFDEHFGLSEETQNILCSITKENANDFARNYLVKTDAEWKCFHHSRRTLESCMAEFVRLKETYQNYRQKIKNIYDYALFGDVDPLFNISAQKEFYAKTLRIVENARHNLFFRFKKYEQILALE